MQNPVPAVSIKYLSITIDLCNMKNFSTILLVLFMLSGQGLFAQSNFHVSQLPPIPDEEGFAGMFAGVSNGALLCMGGANFPEAMPWEGGQKVWYDYIFVLENEHGNWKKLEDGLPTPSGYGVSVNYRNQIILIGGSNAQEHSNRVIGVEYRNGEVLFDDSYPRLPVPLAMMCGTLVGNTIYVAGGLETPDGMPIARFLSLDLTKPASEWVWEELPSWPGPPRQLAIAASKDGKFYLFSGIRSFIDDDGHPDREMLKDAYMYDPVTQDWSTLPAMPQSIAAGPSPAPVFGLNHIVFPGGLDEATARFPDPRNHPGFLEEIWAFNTMTQSYVRMGSMPEGASRLTLPATQWNGQWVIPNGESGPGVRSPEVYAISDSIEFGMSNWAFFLLYLIAMLLIGYKYSKSNITTDDYFVAGRRIPWWAAGLSIYGTQLSAITFMAMPAIVYATDWTLAIGSLMILAIVPLIIKYYLPFFRRLNVVTAYQYLEERFNVKVRTLASVAFMLMQLARMGIVLYLPSIAIASVTGIDIYLCIGIMGVICTIYTVMGGIEAVIWTDVVQVIVLLGGAICCIVIAILQVDGGLSEVIQKGMEYDKFIMFHSGWDPSRLVVWVAVVSFFFLNLIPYTSDQTVVQRYLTVRDEKAAAKSLWTNGLLTLPGIIVFFGLGTTLFVYYLDNPAVISSSRPDELLPYYIVQELPVGVAGIVIAAIFAASMSSLDSSMNSITSAYITDIHARFRRNTSDQGNLRQARWLTIWIGVVGTGSAMWIAAANVEFIFDFFQEVLGLFGGGLAGIFILAVFLPRANGAGAIAGLFGSALITWLVRSQTDITVYLYGAVGVVSCVVIGYVVSLMSQGDKG